MNLSDHFTLAEVNHSELASRNGIINEAPESMYSTLRKTAIGMEKVRATLNNLPITVSSWYRCLPLNRLLKSPDTSQHPKGEAVDFICPAFGTPLDICRAIIKNKEIVRFDQLVFEHTWVHISWNSDPSGKQKGEVLTLLPNVGYARGLTSPTGVLYEFNS